MNSKAIVLLSGGQDSTTCLFWAIKEGFDIVALTINYGQRHLSEIESAIRVNRIAGSFRHEIYTLPTLPVESALTNTEKDINAPHAINPDLPASFVPGRNALFLALATSFGYSLGANDIVIGVNQTDFSGYPDCRTPFVLSMEQAMCQALEARIHFHVPLINMPKADICTMGYTLGDKCVQALSFTTTCYNGSYPPCGECPSCKIRAKGFLDAGLKDPLLLR